MTAESEQNILKLNPHYSVQTGHAARGIHRRVVDALGMMPEGVPGFVGIDVRRAQDIRRAMRRTPRSGRR